MLRAVVTLSAIAGLAGSAAAIDYNELVDGDLSNDRFAPTQLALDLGSNTVLMDVVNSNDVSGDLDYFTISVGAGQSIDSIVLTESSLPFGGFDDNAFIGLAFDDFFDFDPDTLTGNGLVGFILTGGQVGGNILPALADNATSLGPGDYTFWVQQTGDDVTRIGLDINLVPAPGAAAVLSLAGLVAARRRR